MTGADSSRSAPPPDRPATRPPGPDAPAQGPSARLNRVLFALALLIFLVTRLVGLERFPIFFFCDEAVQTVEAANLVRNGFRDEAGRLFPAYFKNDEFYNLSVGVYVQVLPTVVFGRSVFVTRATQVLVLFSAMIAVGLMMRDFFGLRFWWLAVLVLSGFPGWFLHTRIAFELMLATAFYVWFLYFYLRYRSGRTRSIFPAVLFGALTFYGYNAFQPVIVLTALLLAASDAPYHWRHRRTLVWTLPLLLLVVLPYLRFHRDHPGQIRDRLRAMYSYWIEPGRTAGQKLRTYGTQYARGYSPRYWFRPDPPEDFPRHKMKGRAYLPLAALPFALAGVVLCLRRIRSPASRALLAALVAAPAGAALVAPGITRAMTLVVVVAMLVAVAADALLVFASRFLAPAAVAVAVFAGLAVAQGRMLGDALVNGPTWYRDYGLSGMQWGARELFGAVRRYRERSPNLPIFITPVWANGADSLLHFFLPGDEKTRFANVDWVRSARRDFPEGTLFVMNEEEYGRARSDRRFAEVRVDQTIAYPDGRPGFRFVRLRYAADFDALIAAERESWHRLVEEELVVAGERVRVAHSVFDAGEIKDLFDGNPATLVRTENANPAVVVVEFPRPRRLSTIRLTTGSMQFELTVALSGPDGTRTLTRRYMDLPDDPTVVIALPDGAPVSRVRLEVRDVNSEEPAKVHLREVGLL